MEVPLLRTKLAHEAQNHRRASNYGAATSGHVQIQQMLQPVRDERQGRPEGCDYDVRRVPEDGEQGKGSRQAFGARPEAQPALLVARSHHVRMHWGRTFVYELAVPVLY